MVLLAVVVSVINGGCITDVHGSDKTQNFTKSSGHHFWQLPSLKMPWNRCLFIAALGRSFHVGINRGLGDLADGHALQCAPNVDGAKNCHIKRSTSQKSQRNICVHRDRNFTIIATPAATNHCIIQSSTNKQRQPRWYSVQSSPLSY